MNLDPLFAALYPLIDEANAEGLARAAGTIRSAIFWLQFGRVTLLGVAASLRDLAAKYQSTDIDFNVPTAAKVADIYSRAAALIEAEAARQANAKEVA